MRAGEKYGRKTKSTKQAAPDTGISQGATLNEVLSKVGRIIDRGATYLYDPNSII